MIFKKGELRKLLKSKGVKDLDDFNLLTSELSKEVVESLLDGELTDHLGFEKYAHSAKTSENIFKLLPMNVHKADLKK